MSDCCGDTPISNLKADLTNGTAGYRRYNYFRFDNPQSPVPAQIQDVEEVRRFFIDFDFVPYAGTERYTSHALQAFLLSLSGLSPTQSGIIQAKKRMAFGGKVQIIRRDDPTFDLGEPAPATDAEKRQFFEFLNLIQIFDVADNRISVRDLVKYQFENDEGNGNFYFEMVRVDVRGEKMFRVYDYDPTHCLYVATNPGDPRYIAVSPIWTTDYINRNPPKVLPVYPYWSDDGQGVQRTIVHIKNGNYTWYGRPISQASILDQFLEFQNADYKSKHTATNFVGQALIEVEDADQDGGLLDDSTAQTDGFRDAVDQFGKNFTNEARKPQRVLLMSRPAGAKQAFVFQFNPNTQEQWFKVTSEDARDNILRSHGFPGHLLGIDMATGFSSNIYLDVFEIYDATMNKDIQTEFAATVNDIIVKEAAMFSGWIR